MFHRDGVQGVQGVETRSEDTFLGKGTSVSGKITLGGPARLEGDVEGEIVAEDVVTIGQTAVVKARVTGTTIAVHGEVTGDITARVRLELHGTCRVRGNINAPKLVIHEGAVFEGQCAMSEPPAEARLPRAVAVAV